MGKPKSRRSYEEEEEEKKYECVCVRDVESMCGIDSDPNLPQYVMGGSCSQCGGEMSSSNFQPKEMECQRSPMMGGNNYAQPTYDYQISPQNNMAIYQPPSQNYNAPYGMLPQVSQHPHQPQTLPQAPCQNIGNTMPQNSPNNVNTLGAQKPTNNMPSHQHHGHTHAHNQVHGQGCAKAANELKEGNDTMNKQYLLNTSDCQVGLQKIECTLDNKKTYIEINCNFNLKTTPERYNVDVGEICQVLKGEVEKSIAAHCNAKEEAITNEKNCLKTTVLTDPKALTILAKLANRS